MPDSSPSDGRDQPLLDNRTAKVPTDASQDLVGHAGQNLPVATRSDVPSDARPHTPGVERQDVLASARPLPVDTRQDVPNDAQQDPRTKTHKKVSQHGVLYIWYLEVASCVLMLLALAAVIIIIAIFDGHPSPSWPFDISVNALVSVFLVVMKTSMMFPLNEAISHLKWLWYKRSPRPLAHLAIFDNASRGPYGALQLLWTQRGAHLASLGALIALLSLVIDPFTQQVIGTKQCPVKQDALAASVPRTQNYIAVGGRLGAGQYSLHLPMQSAIYNGVYNPTPPLLPFECSTGNCTFPYIAEDVSYSTVGMCSTCVDLTDKLVRGNATAACSGLSGMCEAIPDGPALSSSSSRLLNIEPSNTTPTVGGLPKSILNGTLGTFKMISVSVYPCYDSNYTACQQHLFAAQCALYPCVKTYTASIDAGKLNETLQKVTPMDLVDDGKSFSLYRAEVSPCNQTERGTCRYEYGASSRMALQDFWETFVNGSLATGGAWLSSEPVGKPDWLNRLFNGARIDLNTTSTLISQLADAMTMQIRVAGAADASRPALGTVFEVKSCIHIRWGWMAMPIGLVVITLVFMLATMVQSHRWNGAIDWKGSVWALLFGKVEWNAPGKSVSLYTVDSASKDIAKARVHLEKGNSGWEFVET